MKIIIAGAGIGGLTAAMCLHRAGHDVQVYEAVSEMRPLGVGINIQAGAVRILCSLGLEPALAATAIETRELRFANRHGQTIWADPRGRHAGLPWPQFSIHRGELQMILFRAAQEMLGVGRIKFGRRIADFAAMNSMWDAWVPAGHTPARATVESKLAAPKYRVEIKVVAAA